MIQMQDMEITGPTRAIVCFGPMTDMTGMRSGEFYQVTIDPAFKSPGGEYMRFDGRKAEPDEIHGWQRIASLTICEVLEVLGKDPEGQVVTMRVVKE